MQHWHVGFGLAGYGPEGENTDTCTTVLETANAASGRLNEAADQAYQTADALGESGDYEAAWKTLKVSERLSAQSHNLDADKRREAPLYKDDPAKLEESMQHLLDEAPWEVSEYGRLYVWTCSEDECTKEEDG